MMSATTYHPEEIRAALRKRHGTMAAFALSRGLNAQQIADWLRGRASALVAAAIADELGLAEVHVEKHSMNMDNSADVSGAHRLIAEAR